MKVGWRGLVSGAITVFLISCIVLAIGIFMGDCFIYSGMKHMENRDSFQGYADFITASRVNIFNPMSYYCAGITLHAAQDYPGAVIYYNQVIKRAPYFLQVKEARNKALPKA